MSKNKLLKQIRKILRNAPAWQKLPLVVPKEIVDFARKHSSLLGETPSQEGK